MASLEQKDGGIPNLLNQGLPSDPTEGKLASLHLRLSQGPNQLELRESHTKVLKAQSLLPLVLTSDKYARNAPGSDCPLSQLVEPVGHCPWC